MLATLILLFVAVVIVLAIERVGDTLDRRNHRDIEHPTGKERLGR